MGLFLLGWDDEADVKFGGRCACNFMVQTEMTCAFEGGRSFWFVDEKVSISRWATHNQFEEQRAKRKVADLPFR